MFRRADFQDLERLGVLLDPKVIDQRARLELIQNQLLRKVLETECENIGVVHSADRYGGSSRLPDRRQSS